MKHADACAGRKESSHLRRVPPCDIIHRRRLPGTVRGQDEKYFPCDRDRTLLG